MDTFLTNLVNGVALGAVCGLFASAPHAKADRPRVLYSEDLPAVEVVSLHDRDLPAGTYELLLRTATAHPDQPAPHLLGEGGPS